MTPQRKSRKWLRFWIVFVCFSVGFTVVFYTNIPWIDVIIGGSIFGAVILPLILRRFSD